MRTGRQQEEACGVNVIRPSQRKDSVFMYIH